MNLDAWKSLVAELKAKVIVLYLATKHPKTPAIAKLVAVVTIAYALSPIDLIPDFIPVLGYLDDLLLVPMGLWLAVKLVPTSVWLECEELAAQETSNPPRSRSAAVVIVLVWLLLVAWFTSWIWSRHITCS